MPVEVPEVWNMYAVLLPMAGLGGILDRERRHSSSLRLVPMSNTEQGRSWDFKPEVDTNAAFEASSLYMLWWRRAVTSQDEQSPAMASGVHWGLHVQPFTHNQGETESRNKSKELTLSEAQRIRI